MARHPYTSHKHQARKRGPHEYTHTHMGVTRGHLKNGEEEILGRHR
jgi:hypothetical protein